MKCDKCGEAILDGFVYEFKGKKVCDDCYIDLLIGVPDVDLSKLPPEARPGCHDILIYWHRNRATPHRYTKNVAINVSRVDDNS